MSHFDPAVHTKWSDVCKVCCERTGLEQTACFVPKTKSAPTGKDIFWLRQHSGILDPESVLVHHLSINPGAGVNALFAYTHKGFLRPLTRVAFLE